MELDAVNKSRRLIRRGNFRLKSGEYQEAFAVFEKALEYHPGSPEITKVLARIKYLQNDYEDGLRILREGVTGELDDEIKSLIGIGLVITGEFEQALDLLKSIQTKTEENIILENICKIKLGIDIETAINQLRTLNSTNIETAPYMALGNHKLRRYNYSIQILKYLPPEWEYLHALGIQYLLLGDFVQANRKIKEAKSVYLANNEEQDDRTIIKLDFDNMASHPDEYTRRDSLFEYKENNILTLEQLEVVLYSEHAINAFSTTFYEILDEIKKHPDIDSELENNIEQWENYKTGGKSK